MMTQCNFLHFDLKVVVPLLINLHYKTEPMSKCCMIKKDGCVYKITSALELVYCALQTAKVPIIVFISGCWLS